MMKKIMEITQEQFDKLKESNNQEKVFKSIVNITAKTKYGVGDTAIKVDNSKPLDVYKNTFNNKDYYYIIINTLDDKTAFAYSLYPMN